MRSEANQEGVQAFNDDKGIADNPYEAGTDEHEKWRDGYKYAEQEYALRDEDEDE